MINMAKHTLKTVILIVLVILVTGTSCSRVSEKSAKSETFSVRISDKPLTFCNPFSLSVGSGRARRAGEQVVVLFKDDYYLFITGGRGYWYSGNMRDWTYVDVPDFPRSCPSVLTDGEALVAWFNERKGRIQKY